MAKLNLSIKEVNKQDFSPIPDGKYNVVIARIDVKESKSGGHYLSVGYQVMDGDFKGRVIFDNVNVAHSNPDVVRIGMERLATIAWATGHTGDSIDDTDDLVNKKQFSIAVKNEEKDGYTNVRVKSIVRTEPVEPSSTKSEVKRPWKV